MLVDSSPFLLVADNDGTRRANVQAARSPQWWPAEYEVLARYKTATNIGDRIAAEHFFRRLTNICAAKRRWQARNNVVSMTGLPV